MKAAIAIFTSFVLLAVVIGLASAADSLTVRWLDTNTVEIVCGYGQVYYDNATAGETWVGACVDSPHYLKSKGVTHALAAKVGAQVIVKDPVDGSWYAVEKVPPHRTFFPFFVAP